MSAVTPPGQQEKQVVQYAIRSGTARKYSQIELEALAGDFRCRKFYLFLYGRPFKIMSDHKPLETVFNKPTHTTSIRVLRIVNRMLDYDFLVQYRPGKENISDYTSRQSVPFHSCTKFEMRTTKEVKRYYVNYVVSSNKPKAVTKEQVQKSTDEEPALREPGKVLPYMDYIVMCRCEGYGFQAVYSRIEYINPSVWV